jgi:acetyltransferase-like isoleucine patch superfamily enzyme
MPFDFDDKNNSCTIGVNISISGFIKGNNNKILIEDSIRLSHLELKINGDNNYVCIQSPLSIKGLSIRIGNHVSANQVKLEIAKGFSIEDGGRFLLYNSGNNLIIGENCMFSNSVTIRCGDSPHLLFDKETGEYLDISEGVFIGNHVWVGECVYITKKATIPNESVAAACAVVTKRFEEENSVIAGNPAKVVRRNAQWIRNRSHLRVGSNYEIAYRTNKAKFDS